MGAGQPVAGQSIGHNQTQIHTNGNGAKPHDIGISFKLPDLTKLPGMAFELTAFSELSEKGPNQQTLTLNNATEHIRKNIIQPTFPHINTNVMSKVIAEIEGLYRKTKLATAIRNTNELRKSDREIADNDLLDLKLVNTGNSDCDKIISFYIADAFLDMDAFKATDGSALRESQKMRTLKTLIDDLKSTAILARSKPKEAEEARVAVIDDDPDGTNIIDIDGDNVADFTHGEHVGELIKAYHRNTKIVYFDVGTIGNASSNHPGQLSLNKAVEQMKLVQRHLRRGEHFDAVNYSIASHMPLELMKGINLGSAKERKSLKTAIWYNGLQISPLKQIYEEIHEIERVNPSVPFYVAAGNHGKDRISLASLAEGVHTCAAIKPGGNLEKYSADNVLITDKEQGTYEIRFIPAKNSQSAGFDINQDGIVDIQANDPRLSKGEPSTKKFVGKTIEDINFQISIFGPLKVFRPESDMKKRLFSLEDSKPLNPEDDMIEKLFGGLSDYHGEYFELPDGDKTTIPKFGYRTDKSGKIIYDPLNTGHDNVVGFVPGTSFVPPTIIGKNLAARYPKPSVK